MGFDPLFLSDIEREKIPRSGGGLKDRHGGVRQAIND
jgi:hypothetical protein